MIATEDALRAARSVHCKIADITAEFAVMGLPKEQENKAQGFKFRGIDDLMIYLAPLLAKHRLIIIPKYQSRTIIERPTKNGGLMFFVTVEAIFTFVSADDGSMATCTVYGEGQDSGDKATAKAASAAYKTACFQTFCIPVEGSPDSDAEAHEAVAPKPVKPPEDFVDEIPDPYPGEWRDLVCHGGSVKGSRLGEIPDTKLQEMVGSYNPKKGDKGYKLKDALLRSALCAAAVELWPDTV